MANYRLSSVVDYYLLLTLQFEAENGKAEIGSHAQERFLARVKTSVANYEEGLSTTILNYLTLACFGEARHADRLATGNIPELDSATGRRALCSQALNYELVSSLERLVELFNDYDWSSAYGGSKWGDIAEFALSFAQGKITKQYFVDHIIDLAHNGGFAFDKYQALEKAGLDADMAQWQLVEFLNLKTFSSSLLRVDLPDNLFQYVSAGVARQVMRYFTIFRPGEVPDARWSSCTAEFPITKVLVWGDEVLSEITESARHHCYECGDAVDEDDAYCDDYGHIWCEYCWDKCHEVCERCGDTVNTNWHTLRNVEGDYWCSDCAHEHAYKCERCDEYHKEPTTTVEGDEWCEECVGKHATFCEHCECYVRDGNTTEVEGEVMCDDCARDVATYCSACEQYVLDEHTVTTGDGRETLCMDCADKHFAQCGYCGEIHVKYHMIYDQPSGQYVCTGGACEARYKDNPNELYEITPYNPWADSNNVPLPFIELVEVKEELPF